MANTAAANPSVGVTELSLWGLLQRLDVVERYKGIARPNEDEQAILDTEADTKKRIPEALGELAQSGVTSAERKSAVAFLEKLLKAVEPGTKAADAKKAKLQELLESVKSAGNAEEPPHVRKARTEQARAQQDYDTVHKEFEKWEKGKKMLAVDELNKLKRAHDDATKRLEAAKSLIEDQLCRRAEAAAALPSALSGARPSLAASSGPGKAKAPTVRVAPTVRKAPSAAAAAAGGGYPGPSSAAMRQAQAAAQVRQEVALEAPVQAKAPPMAMPPPKPRPQKVEEEPEVILSYACTCAAVAELLGIKEKQAAELAERARDFEQHLPPDLWQQVQKRSLEIEKEKKDKAKEAERRKQEKALAKVSGVSAVPVAPTPSAASSSGGGASAKGKLGSAPPPPKAKGKAKPKGGPPPANLKVLATNNRFGGMMAGDSSDDDDDAGGGGGGWTTIKR